jgi:hypothetical protein
MKIQIDLYKEIITNFCKKWKITELAFFGSVLRDNFRSDSDIDVLVQFAPNTNYSLFDLVHVQTELKNIFGREIDLVEKDTIESSRNYLRRQEIFDSAQVIYAS